MITIYYHSSNQSRRRTKAWLTEEGLPFKERFFLKHTLSRAEILMLMTTALNGVEDIISTHSGPYQRYQDQLEELKLSELITLIQEHPHLLKSPIVVDGPKLMAGYDIDRIGMFLPRGRRQVALQNLVRAAEIG